MVDEAKTEAFVLTSRGDSLLNAGKYHEAIVAFNEATKIDPGNGMAYFGKGRVLFQTGKYNAALTMSDQMLAIANQPGGYIEIFAYWLKGRSLHNLYKYEEAKVAYEQVLLLLKDHEALEEDLDMAKVFSSASENLRNLNEAGLVKSQMGQRNRVIPEPGVSDNRKKATETSLIAEILSSKTFWVIAAIVIALYWGHRWGVQEATPWTPQQEQEAIRGCRDYGGIPVHDNQGNYYGCRINGVMQ